ncbi:ATP-binding protein [Kineococcus sp. SYSU DK005]|uniref:ATP-binding protein n=1 Tax=Kineococcus sp. SYSU DK005 TaxID=3383126 RepID=UPI003D7ECC65
MQTRGSPHRPVPFPFLQLDLGGELSAARRARQELRGCCRHLGVDEDACDVVLLLSSELVTNAVLHGAPPVHLDAGFDGARVHLAVSDADPHHPVERAWDPTALGGRGVQLLRDLSEAWGVDVHADGKTVWCRVRLRS